jgi:hypothetical protein
MQDDSLENVMLVLQTFCPTVSSRALLKNLSRDVDSDEIKQLRKILYLSWLIESEIAHYFNCFRAE